VSTATNGESTVSNSFKTQMNQFNAMSKRLQEKVHTALSRQRDARRLAYRMSVRYLSMLNEHHGLLLEYIRGQGYTGSNLIDQWIDREFGIIDRLVTDGHKSVIRAVQEGMTEKQFLAGSALVFIGPRIPKKAHVDALVEAPPMAEPPVDAPIEDQLACAKATLAAQAAQIKELKAELRGLRQHAAKLEDQVNKMIRLGSVAKKALVEA